MEWRAPTPTLAWPNVETGGVAGHSEMVIEATSIQWASSNNATLAVFGWEDNI
jgi:hypothetical protein